MTPEWYPDEVQGGIATYARSLALEAGRLDHDVVVLTATSRSTRDVERPLSSVTVVPVVQVEAGARPRARAFCDTWQRLAQQGLTVDAVEAAEFGGVAALVARTPRFPVLTTRLHTPLALLLERNGGGRIYRDDDEQCDLEQTQVEASGLVTSPTRWLAKEAVRLWGLTEEPMVIANPIRYEGTPSQHSAIGRPLRVLYFGRLEHRKGVLVLAEAVAPLLSRGLVQITFVGSDTKWHGQSARASMLRHLAEAPEATYRFLPALVGAGLDELLQSSDLVVLPSLYENFSYACLESMAQGKAVLATTGSGFAEILEHGRTGILVEPGNVQALRTAIAGCASGAWDIASIANAGRMSLRRFHAERIVPRLCEAYAGVSSRSRSRPHTHLRRVVRSGP